MQEHDTDASSMFGMLSPNSMAVGSTYMEILWHVLSEDCTVALREWYRGMVDVISAADCVSVQSCSVGQHVREIDHSLHIGALLCSCRHTGYHRCVSSLITAAAL